MPTIMNIEEMRKHEWVISWSGGKDSTATIILCHKYGIPIKKIIYVRMMYNEDLPATLPVMVEFVDRAKGVFESWGYPVEIVKGVQTAQDFMNKVYFKSKYEYKMVILMEYVLFVEEPVSLQGLKPLLLRSALAGL